MKSEFGNAEITVCFLLLLLLENKSKKQQNIQYLHPVLTSSISSAASFSAHIDNNPEKCHKMFNISGEIWHFFENSLFPEKLSFYSEKPPTTWFSC